MRLNGPEKFGLRVAGVMRLSSPEMPRISLVLLLLLTAICSASAADSAPEIPFRFTDGFICIQARVAGSGEPLNLLLDSGAGASVLDLRTARRLKVKLGATQKVRGVGSEASAFHIEPFRTSAGAVELPPIPFVTDLSMADDLCSQPIDGLIGVDFFQDRVVQIDYSRRCLRMLAPGSAAVGERLPIKFQNGIICVPVGVNDSPVRWTRLDTGCNDALHWVIPRPRARGGRAGVSIGFMTNESDTALTGVSLGSRSMANVKTALHGRALFDGEAGLLGNGLLSQFLVTVDWRNQQVVLGDSPK